MRIFLCHNVSLIKFLKHGKIIVKLNSIKFTYFMIKIIHLSDLHLDSEKDNFKHTKLIEELLTDMEKYVDDNSILIFSGDFLNKGGVNFTSGVNPFDSVKEKFLKALTDKFPILIDKIFFVPGNHEVDRNDIDKFKDVPFKENLLKSDGVSDEYVKSILSNDKWGEVKGLNLYNNFSKDYYENIEEESKQITQLSNSFVLDVGKRIGISALNSAWLCYDNNDKNNILLGKDQIENSLSFIKDSDIKIAIIHHSLDFLNEREQSEIEKIIYENYDLIFIGHTHEHKSDYVSGIHGNYFISVGKSLTAENSKEHNYKNGYSIVEYYPNEKIIIYFRKYDDYKQTFVENTDFDNSNGILELNITNTNQTFLDFPKYELTINEEFKEFLDDIGANFTNRGKETLKLDDLYVMPYFDKYSLSDDEEKITFVNGETVLNKFIKNEVVNTIVFGEENSGKTALCKTYYQRLFLEEVIPIYLKGKDIKKTSEQDILKLLNKEFLNQYNFPMNRCKSESKFVIIIDDLNTSNLRLRFKKKFINNLYKIGYSTFIIWDEFFSLGELLGSKTVEVDIYELLSFGIDKRFDLICKWTDLFAEDFGDEASRVRHDHQLEKLVNSVIGKNLVPSFPIYILTILQANELVSNQNFEQSTFGHYYDVLIKSTLGNHIKESKEIDKYYSYLSELAYYLFDKKQSGLDEDKLLKFHQYFLREYNIKTSFIEMIDTLIKSHILIKVGECYKLKYKYLYFYFIGKYLSDNLEDAKIRKIVTGLSKRLYQTEVANIYLFLSHHSKSKFIITEIIENAKDLFPNEIILNFKDDISYLNSLVEETYESMSFDPKVSNYEYKRTELKNIAQNNEIESVTDDSIQYDLEEDPNGIDYISQINKAFKTIEILGHIVKNRYASLKTSDKEEIVDELYKLGLRTLSSLFKTLIEGEEYIKSKILELIKNQSDNSLTEKEKESLAKQVLFNMLYMISYSIFKKISTSVSTKDLQPTFQDVKNKYIDNNAIGLIDIAIQMDYYKEFPYDDTKSLTEIFKKNKLPYYILRRLAINFMRMIPMKEQDQQRVGKLLNVSMKTQRLLENTSVIKKQ